MNDKLTPEQRDIYEWVEDALYWHNDSFPLSEFKIFLAAHTAEDDMEDAIEHYAIGGSPIDYTPEDEPSRYQIALEVQAEYLKELNKYSKEKSWEEGQSQSGLFMWLSEKITGDK